MKILTSSVDSSFGSLSTSKSWELHGDATNDLSFSKVEEEFDAMTIPKNEKVEEWCILNWWNLFVLALSC